MATMNSTSDTANENFMTDQGSIRLRCSRARRGPRLAAPATVARAVRRDSETRAAPTAAAPVTAPATPRPGVVVVAGRASSLAGTETDARPTVVPGRAPLGPVEPVASSLPAGRDVEALAAPRAVDDAGGGVRTVASEAGMRVVGDDSDTGPDGRDEAAPDDALDADDADTPDGVDEPGDDCPGFGGGGKDSDPEALDPELVDSGRERSSADALGPPEVDPVDADPVTPGPVDVGVPPGVVRRTMVVEESVLSSRAAVGVPRGPGFSVTGAEAWVGSVAAPAAPDFACVSVIDQSCSLGCGGWADVSAVRWLASREGVGPAVILATQLRSRPVRRRFGQLPRQSRPPVDP